MKGWWSASDRKVTCRRTTIPAVAAPGGAGRDVRRTLPVGQGRGLTHACPGCDDDPVTGQLRSPPEVKVVTKLPESAVEAAKALKDIEGDEHSRAADTLYVAAMVVLTLIWLPRLRTTHASAGAGDHQSQPRAAGTGRAR
jgi:hypothetical protein